MGKWDEYEHCLAEDLVSLVLRHELDCPDIMETVCKLDKHNANVVIEGEKDTLEVFCLHALLLGLVFVVKDSLDLCKTFNERSDLIAEKASEVIYGIVCVFNHVMQKGCDDGFVSKANIAYNNLCNSNRVEDIWLSGASSDALMCFICKIKCLLDHIQF